MMKKHPSIEEEKMTMAYEENLTKKRDQLRAMNDELRLY